MPEFRRDRLGLDPAGHQIAIRACPSDDWFVFRTDLVKGRFMSTLPDDWTTYVPATDRDRLAEHVEQFAEQAEEIASGLAWLQARSEAEPGSPQPASEGGGDDGDG